MNKSYDFVPFLQCKAYKPEGKLYEGTIPITIRTLTPIHISSGKYRIDENKQIYKSFVRINNKTVIPGTSLKGVVRSIAEAVSYSCYKASKEIKHKKLPDKTHEDKESCIICQMFGSMGYKSRLQFSDCYLVNENENSQIIGIPASFSPHPDSLFYYNKEGKYKGHKFYKHGILGIQGKGNLLYEYILENAVFQGKVLFKGLTNEQVQLLCFSMGLSGDIQPKIGYGKGHFYGSISIESEKAWADKAKEYRSNKDSQISNNISKIIDILSFSNAVSSLD